MFESRKVEKVAKIVDNSVIRYKRNDQSKQIHRYMILQIILNGALLAGGCEGG